MENRTWVSLAADKNLNKHIMWYGIDPNDIKVYKIQCAELSHLWKREACLNHKLHLNINIDAEKQASLIHDRLDAF